MPLGLGSKDEVRVKLRIWSWMMAGVGGEVIVEGFPSDIGVDDNGCFWTGCACFLQSEDQLISSFLSLVKCCSEVPKTLADVKRNWMLLNTQASRMLHLKNVLC